MIKLLFAILVLFSFSLPCLVPERSPVNFAKLGKTAQLQIFVINAASSYGLDPVMFLAQAATESSLDPKAENLNEPNKIRSRGLFQIQGPTARRFCKMNNTLLMNHETNTACAAIILKKLKEDFGQDEYAMIKALLAYNAGGVYICGKSGLTKKGNKCKPGHPVNLSYIKNIIIQYQKLGKDLSSAGVDVGKTSDFLAQSKKYLDSLPR